MTDTADALLRRICESWAKAEPIGALIREARAYLSRAQTRDTPPVAICPECGSSMFMLGNRDAAPAAEEPRSAFPSNETLRQQIANDPDDEPSAGDYECTR